MSLLPKDRFVNTLFVMCPPGTTGDEGFLTDISNTIKTFFTQLAAQWLSVNVNGPTAVHSVKAYDMTRLPGERLPHAQITYTFTPNNNTPLPQEVASVLTFEAAPIAGVEPMSTRGRWYLGPLAQAAVTTTGGSRPSPAFIDNCCQSGVEMINTINAETGCNVVIGSQRQHKIDLAIGSRFAYPVVSVSMDNSWDTQRSRGDRPTTRERLPILAPGNVATW